MDPIMRATHAFLEDTEAGLAAVAGAGAPARCRTVRARRGGQGACASASWHPRIAGRSSCTRRRSRRRRGTSSGSPKRSATTTKRCERASARRGVTLPPFTMNPIALGPLERAALAMERAATLLGDRFEGVTVALVPEQVADAGAWRESVRALDRIGRSPRVRVGVYAPPDGPLDGQLGDVGAPFQVDAAELLDFLKEARPRHQRGPGDGRGAGDARRTGSGDGRRGGQVAKPSDQPDASRAHAASRGGNGRGGAHCRREALRAGAGALRE